MTKKVGLVRALFSFSFMTFSMGFSTSQPHSLTAKDKGQEKAGR